LFSSFWSAHALFTLLIDELQGFVRKVAKTSGRTYDGWPSGSSIDSEDTMKFAAMTGVRPMTETFPLEKAQDAYDRMISNKARFRVVLTTGN
jgi:D-arabinose 1-dehydrogenase-like Zn-dependent alcohol dehydrogenase